MPAWRLRVAAAVVGPGGAVYITDDYAGAVYRAAGPLTY